MDSITHIAIGACIGEAFVGKQIGKKAMIWGALAQSIPDIDFITSFWMGPADALLAHRGFTHSILFGIVMTPLFALLADRWHRPHNVQTKTWMLFFGVSIFSHLFIDAFNNYGVGWFVPFSRYRVSFNAIYVADVFFSLWPGIALFGLLFLNIQNRKRAFWVRFGLILPSLYLIYTIYNKTTIDRSVKNIAREQQVHYQDYITMPTPLNNWLWYVVLKQDSGYLIGHRSVFDTQKKIDFHYFPQNASMLDTVSNHEEVLHLIRFARGYYTVEKWGDTLVFNDLRFGQMIGWKYPLAHFAFHYYLAHPFNNRLVVQRGRFEGWNREATLALWERIKGN